MQISLFSHSQPQPFQSPAVSRAPMEEAFEHFKRILLDTFNMETANLKEEISELKEQVNKLNKLLQEKDDQCRHIASVLQAKNAEWKRIKMKLAENKQQRHKNQGSEGDIEVIIEQDNQSKNLIDNSDDRTQLPQSQSNSQSNSQSKSQSKSHSNSMSKSQLQTTAETQSNLDALINLISEYEDNEDGDETTDENDRKFKENVSRNSSFTFAHMETSRIQKRKSHARGCSCCDKFYSATRSPSASNHHPASASADSFLVSPNTPPGFWDTSFTPRQ